MEELFLNQLVVKTTLTILNEVCVKITSNNGRFLIDVSTDELTIINNALNESLECIEGWEYQTRIGWSSAYVKTMLEDISRAYDTFNNLNECNPSTGETP